MVKLLLIFHGTMEYDEDGKAIGENQGAKNIGWYD